VLTSSGIHRGIRSGFPGRHGVSWDGSTETTFALQTGRQSMSQTETDIQLDVREMAPRDRHAIIIKTFETLHPNQAIDLINDHDPKPLYYQFAAEHPGECTWTYLQEGPEVWEVEIRRTQASA
jgi:uncharacterized protein (DUF2249 family)